MEVPAEVLIHNETLGLKGKAGRLLTISDQGYYEVNTKFGDRLHRVLLPIVDTVLIAQEPEELSLGGEIEIER